MSDTGFVSEPENNAAEVVRLNKIIGALMDRAERSTSVQASDFGMFQNTIMLEEQVRARTAKLEAVLRENEKITRDLRESEAKFRGLVSQSLIGIVLIEDGKLSYSNAKFNEMFGFTASEMKDLGPLQVVLEDDRPFVEENLRKRLTGETDRIDFIFRGLRKDGEIVDIECHTSRMTVGTRSLLISLFLDISERTRAAREVGVLQELLREESTHDSLTGLYNRRFLDDSFERELLAAEQGDYPVSVIMGDLDHFKKVNDRHGHLAGDEVLRIFGDLMRRHARANDIFCRYGGEEFLLILPGMSAEGAFDRADLLRRTLAETTVAFGTKLVKVTASFGISSFPANGRTSDDLIAAADGALYAAKAAGRNRVMVSALPKKLDVV